MKKSLNFNFTDTEAAKILGEYLIREGKMKAGTYTGFIRISRPTHGNQFDVNLEVEEQ